MSTIHVVQKLIAIGTHTWKARVASEREFVSVKSADGIRSWRWLFIFDFVIGIPIAIFGAVFFPDEPHTTKVFWLNNWERQRAIERIAEEGREPNKAEYNWRTIRRVLTSWQLWVFAFSWG